MSINPIDMTLGLDGDDCVWMWMHPLGKIRDPKTGAWLDLNAIETDYSRNMVTRDDAWASLQEWYANYSTGLIREHTPDGLTFGHATGDLRLLTPEQMAALVTDDTPPEFARRMTSQTDPVVFAKWRLTDPATRTEHENKQLMFSSPRIRIGFTDNKGREWAVSHLEHSLTAMPAQQEQIPISALSDVRLSHTLGDPNMDTSGAPEPKIDEVKAAGDPAETTARLEALEAQIATIVEQLSTLTAAQHVPEDVPAEGEDEKMAELRASLDDVRKENAALRRESNVAKATGIVAKLALAPDQRDALVKKAAEDFNAFELSIAYVPKLAKNQPSDAAPFGAGVEPDDEPKTESEMVLALASKEKITTTEARRRVRASRNTGGR